GSSFNHDALELHGHVVVDDGHAVTHVRGDDASRDVRQDHQEILVGLVDRVLDDRYHDVLGGAARGARGEAQGPRGRGVIGGREGGAVHGGEVTAQRGD